MRQYQVLSVALAIGLAGCAGIHNEPRNQPLAGIASLAADLGREGGSYADELMVGLSFSGGGTRAAAFAHGALLELDRTQVPSRAGPTSLVDRLDFVSGVSGGSITAAYFGLKKREALADFREKFLLRDAEESISTRMSVVNLGRALSGGVNDSDQFARWLDANLFAGATFREFRAERRPRIWINASDIYNRTPFVFGRAAFAAICSDLSSYPIAEAVAASAAVPLVFTPVVLKAYPEQCPNVLPDWIERARRDPIAPPMLRAFSEGIARYKSGSMKYVKLMDGGLVDNYGLSGFTIARLSSNTAYGPMTPHQAVKLRRVLFLVVDAGRGPSGDWVQTVEGPGGVDLAMAAVDTTIDASVRASFTAFDRTMSEWQNTLVRWRCGLSAAERAKYGVGPNWNCRDLKFFLGRIGFEQLGDERSRELNAVPTRFKLPASSVDALIAAGGDALRGHPTYRAFLQSLGGPLRPRLSPSSVVRLDRPEN